MTCKCLLFNSIPRPRDLSIEYNLVILFPNRTDEDSFQKVKNWVKELKKMLGSEIVLTIVGNKLDLNKDRVIEFETAEK